VSETHPPQRTGQSIGAVLAGIAVGVVLSLGTDSALRASGIFSPLGQQPPMSDSLFLLATAYRIVYGIAGSYIIVRLAPDRPTQHALAGGAIGLVVKHRRRCRDVEPRAPLGPHWYSLALAVTAGALRLARRQAPPDAECCVALVAQTY
jgi:hypothetical protein